MGNIDVITGRGKRDVFLDCDTAVFTRNPAGQLTLLNSILAAINAATPLGVAIPYTSEILPPGGSWLYAEGGSILRASYPDLRDLYIVSRGAVTITEANPGVVTLAGHGFLTGSCISLSTTGVLPTNLAINTNYYVIWIDVDTFRLATSADNARAGTAIDTSGAISAGDHTLWSNPHGINGANSMYLPDIRARVPKGVGDSVINTRTKSGPGFGVAEEDQGQGWQAAGTSTTLKYGLLVADGQTTTVSAAANQSAPYFSTTGQGAASRIIAGSDGINGTPRTGATTQENSIGLRYIVRVR